MHMSGALPQSKSHSVPHHSVEYEFSGTPRTRALRPTLPPLTSDEVPEEGVLSKEYEVP